MISVIIFLATLEEEIRKEEKKVKGWEDKFIETEYNKLAKEKEKYAPKVEEPSFGEKVRSAIDNVKNITRNAYDNTVGLPIAKYQNVKTKGHFKREPASKHKIVYLMHGLFQNEGSQWRYAKQLRKEGYEPFHLKGNHKLGRKGSADKAFEQIEEFHHETKLKNPHYRRDHFSGHSSGADTGIYMATDDRIKKYGIASVQARAPAPYGVKAKTIPQKLLMPFADVDNVEKIAGRRNVVQLYKRKPAVPVEVVAGKNDSLATPDTTAYKHARKHYLIDHPDSTHFGTSGVNKKMNENFIGHLKSMEEAYKKPKDYYEKKPAKKAA